MAVNSLDQTQSHPEPGTTLVEEREHVEIAIIGAGISGIGTAIELERQGVHKTYAILEAREAIGGTWDLFRYPGVRSDSDVQTFSYGFKPWEGNTMIAPGAEILNYIREAAAENGVEEKVRFGQRVVSADWDSAAKRWTLQVDVSDPTGTAAKRIEMTANWIFNAAGYYRYDRANEPTLPGREDFAGQIVHPQYWPEGLDYAGKNVVILGSGATAVTLLPAMAKDAGSVTMLQRTPTYMFPLPEKSPLAKPLQRLLGAERAHHLLRRIHIEFQARNYAMCQKHPRFARWMFRRIAKRYLPADYPVDLHLNPPYNPWDQRVCVIPDGDLYRTVAREDAQIVTDQIERLTAEGIELKSGEFLPCDLLVTATGFIMQAIGGMQLSVDGKPVTLAEHVAFKGMMLSDVPNFAFAIGYFNSSWTLKIGLLADYFVRLLGFMDARGYTTVTPHFTGEMSATRPIMDFGSGYIKRAASAMPRVTSKQPWTTGIRFVDDRRVLTRGRIDDPDLEFSR